MIRIPFIILGLAFFLGSSIIASKIKYMSKQYKILEEIGQFGFWLTFLGIILIIWG